MKTFNIIHGIITLGLAVVLIWTMLPTKTVETPIVSVEQTDIDIKIAHAVDSVLKAVSKTDGQLVDFYLDQQNQINDLTGEVNNLTTQLRVLRNF